MPYKTYSSLNDGLNRADLKEILFRAIGNPRMKSDLNEATVVLAIHGSTEDDRPWKAGEHLADQLRMLELYQEIKTGYHKHEPFLRDAIRSAKGNPILILPMLMSSGYFAETVFPTSLGLPTSPIRSFPAIFQMAHKKVIYGEPLGLHSSMLDLVKKSAKWVLRESPFPFEPALSDTHIALVGHGTPRHSDSRASVDRLIDKLKDQPETCMDAKAFFIEEAPIIRKILDWKTSTKNVVVVPFMIADGPHVSQDIPIELGQSKAEIMRSLEKGKPTWKNPTERGEKRIWISQPVGMTPGILDAVVRQLKDLEALMD